MVFSYYKHKPLTVNFKGGDISVDGGMLLVRQLDERLKIADRVVAALTESTLIEQEALKKRVTDVDCVLYHSGPHLVWTVDSVLGEMNSLIDEVDDFVKSLTPKEDIPPSIYALAAEGSTVCAGRLQMGVSLSIDNGVHWSQVNNGFDETTSVTVLVINGPNILREPLQSSVFRVSQEVFSGQRTMVLIGVPLTTD